MSRLSLPNIESVLNASVGPGLVVRNLVDNSISGIEKALNNNSAYGKLLGHMTSTPSMTISREWIDLTENLVTVNSTLKGAKQVRRVDVEMEIELAAIDNDTYTFMNPGQSQSDWLNSPHASLDTGTGNSAFSLVSLTSGTSGNSTSRVVNVPATSNASLSVTVSGGVITINTATGATISVSTSTANQIVNAINNHSSASLLVQAGLPGTSNGTGIVGAAASAPLAGGALGVRIGAEFVDSAFVTEANYDNLSFVMESQRSRISSVTTLFDCLQTEDFSPSFGDDGNIEGTGVTFMAHGSPANFDVNTGQFAPPYRHRKLDAVVA